MGTMLGETDIDLSKYANLEKAVEDRLPLRQCQDENGCIDIYCKAKPLDNVPQTPSLRTPALPIIQERESESDLKEEFEKREKEYQGKITTLEKEIIGLKKQHEEQTEIARLNATIKEYSEKDLV